MSWKWYNDEDDNKETSKLLERIGFDVPKIRKNDDTIRGKLWRLVLGVGIIDANKYQNLINKKECSYNSNYVKIRGDTKRTFLTSKEYQSRVSQERLVRVLNSFCHQYQRSYPAGLDAIAALYVSISLNW